MPMLKSRHNANKERPWTVTAAALLILLSFIVPFVSGIHKLGLERFAAQYVIIGGFFLIYLFAAFMLFRGSNFLRWVAVIFFVFSALIFPFTISYYSAGVVRNAIIIQTSLWVISCFLLFSRKSAPWFNKA
jgi:hypothetical protein